MPTDETVMTGGPGSPAHGAPAPDDRSPSSRPGDASAAATAKVVLEGVEYTVPVAMAQSLQRDRDRLAGQFGSRIQQYEQRLAALEEDDEPTQDQPGIQPPDPKLLDATSDKYDPERYHRESLTYNHALVQAGIQEVEQRRADDTRRAEATAQQQANWNRNVSDFYQKHPELRGHADLVDAVWRKEFPQLKDLSPAQGFEKLGELTKARMLEIAETGRRLAAPRQPRLETSGTSSRANSRREDAQEEPTEAAHGGLSAAIRAKSRRFRTPFTGGASAA